MNENVRSNSEGLAHEVDARTPTSEIIIAVRDEAERLGIPICYDTLTAIVAPNADLYRKEMFLGSVFAGDVLMSPSILRVRAKLRSEMPGIEGFGK